MMCEFADIGCVVRLTLFVTFPRAVLFGLGREVGLDDRLTPG